LLKVFDFYILYNYLSGLLSIIYRVSLFAKKSRKRIEARYKCFNLQYVEITLLLVNKKIKRRIKQNKFHYSCHLFAIIVYFSEVKLNYKLFPSESKNNVVDLGN
jgi:hypothetical protein